MRSVFQYIIRFLFVVLLFGCSGTRPNAQIPNFLQTYDAGLVNYDVYVVPDTSIEVYNRSPAPDGALVAPLAQGQVAPFNGILLNETASAHIETEYVAAQRRVAADGRRDLQLMAAQAIRDLQHLEAILNADRRSNQITYQAMQDALRQNNTRLPTWSYVVGGILAGSTIVSILIAILGFAF